MKQILYVLLLGLCACSNWFNQETKESTFISDGDTLCVYRSAYSGYYIDLHSNSKACAENVMHCDPTNEMEVMRFVNSISYKYNISSRYHDAADCSQKIGAIDFKISKDGTLSNVHIEMSRYPSEDERSNLMEILKAIPSYKNDFQPISEDMRWRVILYKTKNQ